MFKLILTLILASTSLKVMAQIHQDYVVLRSSETQTQQDTIFGKVHLPKNGVFWNVNITTGLKTTKYKIKEVTALLVNNLYFASIKYGRGYAIVPRIKSGKLDLYYYYIGSDRLKYIQADNIRQGGVTGSIAYDISQVIWSKTSSFYIDNHTNPSFYKVPRSNSAFKEETSIFFKENHELYSQIQDGKLVVKDLIEIIETYNEK